MDGYRDGGVRGRFRVCSGGGGPGRMNGCTGAVGRKGGGHGKSR